MSLRIASYYSYVSVAGTIVLESEPNSISVLEDEKLEKVWSHFDGRQSRVYN
jgi:hypothetical protein